jgi:flagellar motility protein MotE (MotC chaperone)
MRTTTLPLAILLGLVAAGAAAAEDSEPADLGKELVIEYCVNIRDKAAEARSARQAAEMKKLEASLNEKIADLEARTAELRDWVGKQREIQGAAETALVEIYASMDPSIAAQQLAELDTKLASSVLRQLKPRLASAILDEMSPDNAAPLVKIIAAATRRKDEKK